MNGTRRNRRFVKEALVRKLRENKIAELQSIDYSKLRVEQLEVYRSEWPVNSFQIFVPTDVKVVICDYLMARTRYILWQIFIDVSNHWIHQRLTQRVIGEHVDKCPHEMLEAIKAENKRQKEIADSLYWGN